MWRRPSITVREDAMSLLQGAHLKDPPREVWDVEPDRIYFVSESGQARCATLHYSEGSRLVRSVYPGWPA